MRIGCALLVLSMALLAGCGGAKRNEAASAKGVDRGKPGKEQQAEPQEVWVCTEGWKGTPDVGLLIAEQRGYFSDAGINAWVGAPSRPNRCLSYVVGGTHYFGVAREPQVAIAKGKGAPIEAVSSLITEPTAALIWLKKSGIGAISDLKGDTIAIPGLSFQEELLEKVLEENGLRMSDVKVKRVGFGLVSELLEGRADAIFGGSWNLEGAELESRGAKPVIKRVQTLGVPSYEELVLIARTNSVEENPGLAHRFLSAVARGTAVALKNPAAAIEAVEKSDEPDPELSPKSVAAEVRATLPLLSRTGYLNPAKGRALLRWAHEQGWMQQEVSVSQMLNNDYLASRP